MKSKDLIKLLEQYPEAEINLVYEYGVVKLQRIDYGVVDHKGIFVSRECFDPEPEDDEIEITDIGIVV